MSINRGLTRDDDDNITFFYERMKNTVCLTDDPLRPVADDGVSAAFRYGYA